MMRIVYRGLAAAMFGLCLWPVPFAVAQSLTTEQATITSSVAVLEVDRMFSDSLWGKRVIAEIQSGVAIIEGQNAQIESDLSAEEEDLTEQRATLSAEEFRDLADAFDEKVRAIRQATDNKVAELNARQQAEFDAFRSETSIILFAVASDLNVTAILDKRSVYLSFENIDITDLVISRIDEVLGDGSEIE